MIERLRELLSKATPRPWTLVSGFIGDKQRLFIRRPGEDGVCMGRHHDVDVNKRHDNDAELVVEAINSLPELIDRLERAEARVQELEQILAVVAKNASHRLGGECGACKHEYTGAPCHYETHQDCTKCWHDYLIGNTEIVEPNCFIADGSGKCLGYSSENDDEPIDMCKRCPRYTSYTIDQ